MAYSVMLNLATGDLVTESEWDKVGNNFSAIVPFGPDAWVAWTPTLANVTVGNGTLTAAYQRVGRWVAFNIKFVFGSTSAMGTGPTYTLPVTANARYSSAADTYGQTTFLDASTGGLFHGRSLRSSTTVGTMFVDLASTTHVNSANVTSSVPFTWTTSDAFVVQGWFEAAS